MIPREILKKIRQSELRTNRIATEFAECGCVRSTSRSTPAISKVPTNHHALRLGLRPQPRSISVNQNSKPLEFETFRNQALGARLVLIPLNSTGLEFKPANKCHD